ncbi:MAG: MFS transporter [Hyphomicrobiales bacterium]|nr:MFS transporter [Hyphomicrobiales bacterium]MBV8823416.1 MFS transporter [Hyphomicrobiales bacterium]MBV9426199.1 MFS transporter [Bradyrhizobiaceae bacterium]
MRHGALAPFRVRSFRFQWPADLLASWAFEMENLILGWYILVETGSVLLLTVFAALQYLGTMIAPLIGVAGDRVGHRNVLFAMRVVFTLSAAILMTLAFAHAITPLYVLIIVGLNGLLRPSDQGVRTALVAHTMPTEHLIGALAVARTTVDSARIAGALAGAGLFVALGLGPAYVFVTCFYLGGALLTLGVTGPRIVREGTGASGMPSPWQDLKEGVAYVLATPGVHATMWIALLVNATAFPLTNGLLPYVAKNIYGADETGLGYLVASFAAGALVGSIALMLAGARMRLARMMIVSSAAWYVALLVFAHAGGLSGGTTSLLLAGFMQSLCMVSLSAILMHTADPRFRGRVMGVRMLGIYGLPLGLLCAGALVGRIGFATTATLYAVTGLVLTILIAIRWRGQIWATRN